LAKASNRCKDPSSKPRIVSKEIDSISGNILIDMYLVIYDSLHITGEFQISSPAYIDVQVSSIPDTSIWYIPGDTVYFNGTISHGIGWVPFFSQTFEIKHKIVHEGNRELINYQGYLYFTPWGSVEIWDNFDYFTIGRVWKQSGNGVDTTRIFVPKNKIPITDFNAEDSFEEEWMSEFELADTLGLGFYVKKQPKHPDTVQYFANHFGDDSIYHEFNDSTISGPAPNYTGVIEGRLVTTFRNDLDEIVTMPLSGVFVKLMEKDRYNNEEFGTTHTDENGFFSISYDKDQVLEFGEIELWLLFKSKNSDAKLVVCRPNLNFIDLAIFASSEAFEARRGDPIRVEQTAGTINVGNVFCEDHAFWVTHWAMNAYRFAAVSNKFTNNGKSLKIKLNAEYSKCVAKVISLVNDDDDHENTIYHEYGHFIMYALQNNGYINLVGYTHLVDGTHGGNCKGILNHHWYHEEHSRIAWTEGFADAIEMILDGANFSDDLEYGWDITSVHNFDERDGFEIRGTNYFDGKDQTEKPKEINNGFNSEYYFACAIYDMWDGPGKGLPDPSLNSLSAEPNIHPFNDRRFDNSNGNWPNFDDVTLNFDDLIKPLEIHDGSNKLHNIEEYINSLLNEVYASNCNAKRGVGKCLFNNRVVLTISDVESFGENWNTMISTDIIGEAVEDEDLGKTWLCANVSDDIMYWREFIEFHPNFSHQVSNISSLPISNFQISDNLHLGYNFTTSTDRSEFLYNVVNTNLNLNMHTCGDVNWSINNTDFIIGDGTNTSIIEFWDNSVLKLDPLSKLVINNNSRLTIDVGSTLQFFTGAQIILNGPNAVLEIKGQIQIMDGATFTFTGGDDGLGYIKFFKNANSGPEALIISPNNDGKVELIGTSSSDKLIEIDGTEGLKLNSDIIDFTIKQAKILLGDRSTIEPNVSGKVFFESVKIDQLFNDYEHNGIRINGVKNEFHLVTVTGGNYGFVNTGLIIGNEKLNLRAVHIVECSIGIMTYSSGINYLGGLIKGYSIAGWKSVGANVPSDITGVWFNNDQSNSGVFGVLLDGVNSAGSSTFTGSKFQSNASGIQAWNVPVRLKSCNYFEANDIGIQMEAWSNLDLSNNSYTTFNGNDIHILSRFHGIMHMNDGHNGFLSSGNSSIFWASLQPGAQSPSVTYLTLAPTPENYYANNNFFQTTPSWGNNFYLDERGSRVLNLTTNNFYPNNNPSVWTSAQNNVCGTPDYETLEFTFNGGGLGQFNVSKYSTLSGVTIPSGLEYGNNLLNVCSGLLDSLYMGYAPNYSSITCGLGHLARKTFSNNSPIMANLKLELLDHAIKAYAIGVSKNAIFVREDSLSFASNCLLGTIDTLLIDANNDSLPWKNVKFNLSAAKAEVLRIAEHRDDASMYLNSALNIYTDSLEQIYLNKWSCIIEAEQAFIDSLVTLDSIYINYPCYGQEIEFSAPMPNTTEIDIPTKKKEELKNSMFVYPNPASDLLKVVLNNKQEIVKIVICDLKGMVLYSSEISAQNSETEIDLSAFSSGSYVISVMSDQAVFHSPLIISK